jgi:hypothetical protein
VLVLVQLLLVLLLLLSLVWVLAVVTTEELLPLFSSRSSNNSGTYNSIVYEPPFSFNSSYQPPPPPANQLSLRDFQKLVWLSAAAYCGSEQILRGHSWRDTVVEGFVPTMAIRGELDTDVREL